MVLLYNKLDGIEVSGKSDASNWCNQLRDLMNFGGKNGDYQRDIGFNWACYVKQWRHEIFRVTNLIDLWDFKSFSSI